MSSRHIGVVCLTMLALALCPTSARAASTGGQPDDHFMCYKVKSSKTSICADGTPSEGSACTSDVDCGGGADTCVKNKFAKTEVGLQDGFEAVGPADHTAIKPQHLCVPANKNGEGIVDDVTHLVSYRIKRSKEASPFAAPSSVLVFNQFGEFLVDVVKADRLLVPAAKDLGAPIAEPDNTAHNVDHYKCYKAKLSKAGPKLARDLQPTVEDQFENVPYDIKKATRLCRPVDKYIGGVKDASIKTVGGDLMCFKPKPAAKHARRLGVHTNDQLGPAIFDTIKQDDFCVPSAVVSAEPNCDPVNRTECLLPYPSTAYVTDDVTTDTGIRLDIPDSGLPQLIGTPLAAAPFNARDGFSPTVQILMHFRQGVDPILSDASHLIAPGEIGQPAGPPWIDTRTHDDRSLDVDSPTLLLDANTGEQILHWIESDARAADLPHRRTLVLRPAVSLKPNQRYIVAARDLKTADGSDVLPEANFLVLRDGISTSVAEIEARRTYYDSEIFAPLTSFGVSRSGLLLAFDFITQSEDQLTHQILSMRDTAYSWLATVEADPLAAPFTVDPLGTDGDCMNPAVKIWRRVTGTFESPLFLDADLSDGAPQFMNVDGDDNPVQNGFTNANFTITIPCNALDALAGTPRPVLLGHGLFQTGFEFDGLVVDELVGVRPDANLIAGSTDWRGMSTLDLAWLWANVIGFGSSQLHNFEALPDRLSQGMVNTLVLARMMKLGIFNRDAAFHRPDTSGVFPGSSEEMYYYGASLGGIMGTWLASLSPDMVKFGLDVPAMNFACMLQRATPFGLFEVLLDSIGLADPLDYLMGVGLLHELWVSAEPAGFVHHVTTDRLAGSGPVPGLYMTPAWLDKQVSNQCTEVLTRSLGIPNMSDASMQHALVGIPDVTGPLASAHVMWDAGSFDLFNPAHQEFIPPLANLIPSDKCDPHAKRPLIPATIDMLIDYMQPGGVLTNACVGICDGDDSSEIPLGGASPCDPLN